MLFKYLLRYSFLVFIFAFSTEGGYAQSLSRFKAAATIGLNFSQVDGDLQQGYKKIGTRFGVIGNIFLKHSLDISTELYYGYRGAKSIDAQKAISNRQIRTEIDLQYADIVVLLNHQYSPNSDYRYYRQMLSMGFSFGRLVNQKMAVYDNTQRLTEYETFLLKNFRKNDISFIVGATWQVSPRLGFNVRHSVSLIRLYDKLKAIPGAQLNEQNSYNYLRPYHLSFQVVYNFIAPSKISDVKLSKKRTIKDDPLEQL